MPSAHMERIREVAGEYIAGMTPTVAVPGQLALEVDGHWQTRHVSFIGVDRDDVWRGERFQSLPEASGQSPAVGFRAARRRLRHRRRRKNGLAAPAENGHGRGTASGRRAAQSPRPSEHNSPTTIAARDDRPRRVELSPRQKGRAGARRRRRLGARHARKSVCPRRPAASVRSGPRHAYRRRAGHRPGPRRDGRRRAIFLVHARRRREGHGADGGHAAQGGQR